MKQTAELREWMRKEKEWHMKVIYNVGLWGMMMAVSCVVFVLMASILIGLADKTW
jgi:hypothetical protein